jgi:enoyl-CoA hydratase/carnithine racemase
MAGSMISIGRDGAVGVVAMDRPEARNALTAAAMADLDAALAELSRDARIGAIVLTGEGGAFCSGADLKEDSHDGSGLFAATSRLRIFHRLLVRLVDVRKPVVAAVEGPAVGIGWSLALASDIVVCGEGAFFAAPLVPKALVPDGGVSWFLYRTVGRHRAAELSLLGDRLSARSAERMGLANRVVESGTSRAEATELAQRLAAGPRDTTVLALDLLDRADRLSLTDFLAAEALAASLNDAGPDAAEGIRAFREGRPPRFAPVAGA